jgi:hypothetical protein
MSLATAPNVMVYVPTGALLNVADVPVPERVAGPVRVNVALAVFVVTLMVPVTITVPCSEIVVGEMERQ